MQGKAKKSIKILSFLHWVHLTLQLSTFFLWICAEENGIVDEKVLKEEIRNNNNKEKRMEKRNEIERKK